MNDFFWRTPSDEQNSKVWIRKDSDDRFSLMLSCPIAKMIMQALKAERYEGRKMGEHTNCTALNGWHDSVDIADVPPEQQISEEYECLIVTSRKITRVKLK